MNLSLILKDFQNGLYKILAKKYNLPRNYNAKWTVEKCINATVRYIDSLCIGICSSMIGYSSFLFPILVATFQLVFLSVGRVLGNKISSISNILSKSFRKYIT